MPYIGSVQGTTKDPRIPDASAQSGEVLTSDGTSWQTQAVPTELPQAGMAAEQVLTYDGAAWTFADPGGAGGSMKAIASGALAGGDKVVLKNDGKVEKVGTTPGSWDVATAAVDDNNTQDMAGSLRTWAHIDYDPNNKDKFVVFYIDASSVSPDNKPSVQVGTISGTTISFGSEVEVAASAIQLQESQRVSVRYHPTIANLIICAWGDSSGINVRAGQVSGTSVTFGTVRSYSPQTIDFDSKCSVDVDWDIEGSVARRFVCIFSRWNPGMPDPMMGTEEVQMFAGMVSSDAGADITSDGTTTGVGSGVMVMDATGGNPGEADEMNPTNPVVRCDPNQEGRFVIVFDEFVGMPGNKLSAVCSLNSTTGITKNTNRTVGTARVDMQWLEFIGTGMLWQYKDNFGKSAIKHGIFNGPDNFTFGTEFIMENNAAYNFGRPLVSAVSNTSFYAVFGYDQKVHVRGYDMTGSGGLTIANSAGAAVELDTGWIMNDLSAASDGQSTEPRIIVVGNGGGMPSSPSRFTTAKIGTQTAGASNLTETNFIGISDDAYADGIEATIQLAGAVDENQSGLTVGSTYFTQPDGTLSTTPHATRVVAGVATAATKLLIADSLAEHYARVAANTIAQGLHTTATTWITANNTSATSYADAQIAAIPSTPTVIGSQTTATANGAIGNGKPVILESDGKVTQVSNTGIALDTVTSDSNEYSLGWRSHLVEPSVSYDPNNNNKFVAVGHKKDGDNNLIITRVGTISGDTISLEAEETIHSYLGFEPTGQHAPPIIKYHPTQANLIGLCYGWGTGAQPGETGDAWFKTGVVGATGITWNNEYTLTSGRNFAATGRFAFDWCKQSALGGSTMKFGIAWFVPEGFGGSPGKQGNCIVGTCDTTGGMVSVGMSQDLYGGVTNNSPATQTALAFDPYIADKFLVSYLINDSGGGHSPGLRICTASGTAITLGSQHHLGYNGNDLFRSNENHNAIWNPGTANQLIFSGRKSATPRMAIGTVTGTAVSWGPHLEYAPGYSNQYEAWLLFTGQTPATRFYGLTSATTGWSTDRYIDVQAFNISGTTISNQGNPATVAQHEWENNAIEEPFAMAADAAGVKAMAIHVARGGSPNPTQLTTFDFGTAGVTNLTTTNYMGCSDADCADGASATIQMSGAIDDAQSGLTPGSKYYVQPDGNLSTTVGTPRVLAGTALSSTSVLLADAHSSQLQEDPRIPEPAIAGQVLTSNGSAWLTQALPETAPAGGSFTATADGALADGDRVVLQADGKVKKVAVLESAADSVADDGQSQTLGVRNDSWPAKVDTDPNDNTKFVICYKNASGAISAKMGAIAPVTNAITFGAETTFPGGPAGQNLAEAEIKFHPTTPNLFGIVSANSSGPWINFGTVSGTVITAVDSGTVLKGEGMWEQSGKIDFDWDDKWTGSGNRFCAAYTLNDQMSMEVKETWCRAGTVDNSGASFSLGSPAASTGTWMNGQYPQYGHMPFRFDPNTEGKFIVTYIKDGNSQPAAKIGTMDSSHNITFGNETEIDTLGGDSRSLLEWNPGTPNQFIFSWRRAYYPHMIIGTVTGTSISMGALYQSNTNQEELHIPRFGLSPATKFYGFGLQSGKVYGRAFSISGTTISTLQAHPGTEIHDNAGNQHYHASLPTRNNSKVVLAMLDGSNAGDHTKLATATIGEAGVTNLTASNFAGIVSGASADGATATIQTASAVDDAQSGLTTGSNYYLQSDGSLGITPDSQVGEVLVGRAISATKVLIADPRPPVVPSSDPIPGTFQLTANGAISNGDKCVILSNGEVAGLPSTYTALSGTVTDDVTITTPAQSVDPAMAYDTQNDKYLMIFRDPTDGYRGKIVHGTLSGTTITWTNPVQWSQNQAQGQCIVHATSQGKFIIASRDSGNSYRLTVRMGTVAGAGVSLENAITSVDPNNSTATEITMEWDTQHDKVMIAYQDGNNNGECIVGKPVSASTSDWTTGSWSTMVTASGGSTTNGLAVGMWVAEPQGTIPMGAKISSIQSSTVFWLDQPAYFATTTPITFTPDAALAWSNKVRFNTGQVPRLTSSYKPGAQGGSVLFYKDTGSNPQYSKAIPVNIAGDHPTFGTAVQFSDTEYDDYYHSVYDPDSGNMVVNYKQGSDNGGINGKSGVSRVCVLTWDGTYAVPSFPAAVVEAFPAFEDPGNPGNYYETYNCQIGYDEVYNRYFAEFRTQGYPTLSVGVIGHLVSGVLTWGDPFTYSSGHAFTPGNAKSIIFDPDGLKLVLARQENNIVITSIVTTSATLSNLNANNFVGIAKADAADEAVVTIQQHGSVDDAQSGLTPGTLYYVQHDGTLATTAASNPAVSVVAGVALSATKILLK